jgi:hypothetical protein
MRAHISMIDMIVVSCAAWQRNLECCDKSRAVRGSRHRFCTRPAAVRMLKKRRRAGYRLPLHSKSVRSTRTALSPTDYAWRVLP